MYKFWTYYFGSSNNVDKDPPLTGRSKKGNLMKSQIDTLVAFFFYNFFRCLILFFSDYSVNLNVHMFNFI